MAIIPKFQKIPLEINSLLLGCLLPLAFAPLKWFWLAPLVLTGLLAIFLKSSAKRAFWLGLLFGVGYFAVGTSWIYISIHRFGGTNMAIAVMITGLFVWVLALFPAIVGYITVKWFSKNRLMQMLFVFPASWVLLEWVRSWIFSGFPWLLLGDSQVESWLKGYASIIGVYGVSFLVLLSAALLFMIVVQKRKNKFFACIMLSVIWLVGLGASNIHWTERISKPIKVSLIQGNIPQALKWSPKQIVPILKRYQQLTEKHWESDLIVWPEAAVPVPLPYASDYLDQLSGEAKINDSAILLGVPVQVNANQFYNAAVMLGAGHGAYYKKHLVPFGEYVPLENWLRGLIAFFDLPMSNFIAGPFKQRLLMAKGMTIATFICYEIAYPHLLRQNLSRAHLLVTISNDAWFGGSWAAAQHLQIAQMASLMTGRYQLFNSNNGLTAIIQPNGKISMVLPQFKIRVLTGHVYAMRGYTPWVWLHNRTT